MKYSIAFHIIGIVFWVGSLLVLTRLLTLGSQPEFKTSEPLNRIIGRVFFGFTLGGLLVATLTGIFQVSTMGAAYYMKQGWFHGKLTLVLFLYGATVATGLQIKKFQSGQPVSRGLAGMLHGTVSLILLIAVLLTILGR